MRTAAKARTSQLTTACINLLLYLGHFVHRQNNMGWQNKQGRWINPKGIKGTPDIIGCAKNGKFLGVEIKTGDDRLSPDQTAYMIKITARSGYYLTASSTEDIINWHNKTFEELQ